MIDRRREDHDTTVSPIPRSEGLERTAIPAISKAGLPSKLLARQRAGRGNACVEFALAFGLILLTLGGAWQFGLAFFIYNRLHSAVRDGARYASVAAYDAPAGSNFRARVRRMVVYGDPNAGTTAQPLVPGLSTGHITVSEEKSGPMPTRITVQVDNFQIDGFFTDFTLTTKPRCRFNYSGQLLASN